MPMRKAHEPHQASRGGLTGSDASGWALLAVRKEARSRSAERWERGRGRVVQLRNTGNVAHQRSRGAGCGAQVALVRVRLAVVLATILACAVVVDSVVMDARVFMYRICMVMVGYIRLDLDGIGRYRSAGRRAGHGHRHRAPNGEQHGEQNQEPDAQELHRKSVSDGQRRVVYGRQFRHRKPCHRGKVKRRSWFRGQLLRTCTAYEA